MAPLIPHWVATPQTLGAQMAREGYAVLAADALAALASQPPGGFAVWQPLWEDLPSDQYLRDGGRYRRRRHGSFTVTGDAAAQVPHRAHWQPLDYNALHGGIERWFEPLHASMAQSPALAALLQGLARCAGKMRPGVTHWFAEVHAFRIDCSDGIGRPTPEGAHRDGVDLVAVLLVSRKNIKGGETRVFDAKGPQGVRFTLTEPWSALLLDDERVIHESTPIQPLDQDQPSHRDTLVITLRRGGFQDP